MLFTVVSASAGLSLLFPQEVKTLAIAIIKIIRFITDLSFQWVNVDGINNGNTIAYCCVTGEKDSNCFPNGCS